MEALNTVVVLLNQCHPQALSRAVDSVNEQKVDFEYDLQFFYNETSEMDLSEITKLFPDVHIIKTTNHPWQWFQKQTKYVDAYWLSEHEFFSPGTLQTFSEKTVDNKCTLLFSKLQPVVTFEWSTNAQPLSQHTYVAVKPLFQLRFCSKRFPHQKVFVFYDTGFCVSHWLRKQIPPPDLGKTITRYQPINEANVIQLKPPVFAIAMWKTKVVDFSINLYMEFLGKMLQQFIDEDEKNDKLATEIAFICGVLLKYGTLPREVMQIVYNAYCHIGLLFQSDAIVEKLKYRIPLVKEYQNVYEERKKIINGDKSKKASLWIDDIDTAPIQKLLENKKYVLHHPILLDELDVLVTDLSSTVPFELPLEIVKQIALVVSRPLNFSNGWKNVLKYVHKLICYSNWHKKQWVPEKFQDKTYIIHPNCVTQAQLDTIIEHKPTVQTNVFTHIFTSVKSLNNLIECIKHLKENLDETIVLNVILKPEVASMEPELKEMYKNQNWILLDICDTYVDICKSMRGSKFFIQPVIFDMAIVNVLAPLLAQNVIIYPSAEIYNELFSNAGIVVNGVNNWPENVKKAIQTYKDSNQKTNQIKELSQTFTEEYCYKQWQNVLVL